MCGSWVENSVWNKTGGKGENGRVSCQNVDCNKHLKVGDYIGVDVAGACDFWTLKENEELIKVII